MRWDFDSTDRRRRQVGDPFDFRQGVDALAIRPGGAKAKNLSHRAVNSHATAIKSLSRWLLRDGRTADYALAMVAKLEEKEDRRYICRPQADAELRKLIAKTRTAPEWRGMNRDRPKLVLRLGSNDWLASDRARCTPARGFRA
jgi:hypothetical protein